MEIVGLGSEIVECPRIGRMIEVHGEQFLNRVFTTREIRSCQARSQPLEHFAGVWAAKCAVARAMRSEHANVASWTDLEIRSQPGGRTEVAVRGRFRDRAETLGIGDILVSIGRCRTYATAQAIAVSAVRAGEDRTTSERPAEPDPAGP